MNRTSTCRNVSNTEHQAYKTEYSVLCFILNVSDFKFEDVHFLRIEYIILSVRNRNRRGKFTEELNEVKYGEKRRVFF